MADQGHLRGMIASVALSNVQGTHWWCNSENGFTRVDYGRPISPLIRRARIRSGIANLLCASCVLD